MSDDSFGTRDTLKVDDTDYRIYRIDKVPGSERLPYSLKVLLENLLRTEDGRLVTREQIEPSRVGIRSRRTTRRSSSPRHAFSCRTSPACRASWTSSPCATP